MKRILGDIDAIGKRYAERYPELDDQSLTIIVHLALAYRAAKRLKNTGATLEIGGRSLVLPTIEKAFREILYIRPELPNLDASEVSKFGRLLDEN
jgi:hypothetical protein